MREKKPSYLKVNYPSHLVENFVDQPLQCSLRYMFNVRE